MNRSVNLPLCHASDFRSGATGSAGAIVQTVSGVPAKPEGTAGLRCRDALVVPFVAAVTFLVGVSTPPLYAATIYVSPDDDDRHAGTREEPLRTISAAADRAVPGDMVLVLEGVYRERIAPGRGGEPRKPVVYRGEPGKRVFVKAFEVWTPQWKNEGDGVFSAKPDESLFDGRSPEYLDHHNPLKVQLAARLAQPSLTTSWGRNERTTTTLSRVRFEICVRGADASSSCKAYRFSKQAASPPLTGRPGLVRRDGKDSDALCHIECNH